MKNYRQIRIWSTLTCSRTLVFFMLVLSLGFTPVHAQSPRITIQMSDTTVEAVLNAIRTQSDINIVYNHEELKKQPRVTVNLKNASIEEALIAAIRNTNLEYQEVNTTIVIKPKKKVSEVPQSSPILITQTVRGQILDRDTKISLPSANVVVLNTNPQQGVISDTDGFFRIDELPVGRYSFQVSYLGYKTEVLSEVLVGSAKEVILTVELSESLADLDEVVVSANKGQPLNEMATISGKSFSVEETKRYAASISDPARMALSFAGVSTSDDASNEIVIRGNSPNWMLWRLEGVEIPSPNHFAEEGYSAGAVSILSNNVLSKSDFYTGAFPAEYGNALSGVFDVRLRNGNNEKAEYSAQVGLLGAELAAEGPFKKGYRGSYLISARYATFSVLNNLNIEVSENALPNYQDLSFKFNFPTKKAGTFALWGIGGVSNSDEKFLPDTTLDQKFEHGYSDYTETGMYATGLTHTFYPDNKSYFKSVVSSSKSFSSETFDQMDSLGVMKGNFFDDLNKNAIRINSYYNRKFTKRLTARVGLTYSYLEYNYFSESYTDSTSMWETNINGSGNTQMLQSYLQTKYKFSDRVLLTAGMHHTYFDLNAENSIEPRVGLQVSLNKGQKFGLGFGVHSRPENLPVYFVEFQNSNGSVSYLNQSLELTRSLHYIASYEKLIGENWALKAEAYYQDIPNLPVANNPDVVFAPSYNGLNPNDTLINGGKAKNYGLELTMQKYFTNNYYLMITSSLFESKYKSYKGEWRNSRYNLNYVNNFVAGKEIHFGSNKMLGLNCKVLWSGGKRIVPINLEASIDKGEAVYNDDEAYTRQMSDYFRIDFGVKLHFFKTKTEHIIAIDVQNLTNRQNDWFQIYDSENEKIINYPMAGIIPVISYRIEF